MMILTAGFFRAIGVLPFKKRRKLESGQDPLKGGFVRAPRRGDASEPLTEAELAASKIKLKVCTLLRMDGQWHCGITMLESIVSTIWASRCCLCRVWVAMRSSGCAMLKHVVIGSPASVQKKPGQGLVPKRNVLKHTKRKMR